jgi:hypothetical protein
MKNIAVSLIFLGWLGGHTLGQDDKIAIQAHEPWTNLFAEQDVTLHFTIAPANLQGRLTWTFAAANGRVYDRGRGEAQVPAGKPVKIMLRTPPLKPGVIQEALLTVNFSADGKDEPAATYQKKIWIFPADPFADRAKWLADLHIKLYDPDAKAKTSAVLKEMKIPFDHVPRAGALDEVQAGVVIVGAGAVFQEDPDLMPALVRAAGRGVRVLCLAPASGSFVVPGSDQESSPGGLALARQDIVRKLDKRLDPFAWAAAGSSSPSSLAIKAEEGKVVAEVVAGNKGWSWLAVDFPLTPLPQADTGSGKGRLVVCSFAIIGAWEASPTPRYLLARILEQFED